MESLDLKTLRHANVRRSLEWTGNANGNVLEKVTGDILFRSNELGGEAGEAMNFVKKIVRQLNGMKGGMSLNEGKQGLAKELADVVICADRLAEVFSIDLGAAVIAKFNETSEKHGFNTRLQ